MWLYSSTAISTIKVPGADDLDTLQEGPTCKIAALASCMRLLYPEDYYPLRKDKQNGVELSVRKIAKEQGSSQGEVTSPGHLSRIAQALGLKVTPISFSNLSEMKYYIRSAIQNGKLVIVFAMVDARCRPTTDPEYMYQDREHGSVVVGYHDNARTLIVHDGFAQEIWKATDLYDSSCHLPKKRSTETFVKFLVPKKLLSTFTGKPSDATRTGGVESHNRSYGDNPKHSIPGSNSCADGGLDKLSLDQVYLYLFDTAECSHDIGNEACRYHDISDFITPDDVITQKKTEALKRLEESGCITIRQSNQEPDANFHKLLMIVERCHS